MDTKTSYKIRSKNNFFFLHGNGFPPQAYQTFLNTLKASGDVFAMSQKPFSKTKIDPNSIFGWDIFKNDALDFLNQLNLKNPIAIGHSMGAIILLVIEIQNPGTFKNIFLLDPVITSRFKSILYRILLKLKLIDKIHPMIKRTNSKKMIYDSQEEIYQSYRSKNIFSKINNKNLKHYIESIIEYKEDKVSIKLSKNWENSIYRNGSLYDSMIWRNLSGINAPTYIITPENNEFGHFNYGRYLKKKNPRIFKNIKINNATHLFPLEYPEETAELITSNIDSMQVIRD